MELAVTIALCKDIGLTERMGNLLGLYLFRWCGEGLTKITFIELFEIHPLSFPNYSNAPASIVIFWTKAFSY